MQEESRRTGQTTRLIDKYIQDIFTKPNKIHYIRDHHPFPHIVGHKRIFDRVMTRLQMEHRIETNKEFYFSKFSKNLVGVLKIDTGKLTIELRVFIRDTSDDSDIHDIMSTIR